MSEPRREEVADKDIPCLQVFFPLKWWQWGAFLAIFGIGAPLAFTRWAAEGKEVHLFICYFAVCGIMIIALAVASYFSRIDPDKDCPAVCKERRPRSQNDCLRGMLPQQIIDLTTKKARFASAVEGIHNAVGQLGNPPVIQDWDKLDPAVRSEIVETARRIVTKSRHAAEKPFQNALAHFDVVPREKLVEVNGNIHLCSRNIASLWELVRNKDGDPTGEQRTRLYHETASAAKDLLSLATDVLQTAPIPYEE